jgi:hypothetical protein
LPDPWLKLPSSASYLPFNVFATHHGCRHRKRPSSADVVEKVAVWMQMIASASHLARADHVEVSSSVQMMGFAG